LGFLGLFGSIITLIEAFILQEFDDLKQKIDDGNTPFIM
jgi:hypothetical protein